ncbi:hypothetical protein BD309DRAFT_980782 [Dichomitus squalens]|nr:hypothetical protein BD309DRAFT_980782 [Dichomitus squalens]
MRSCTELILLAFSLVSCLVLRCPPPSTDAADLSPLGIMKHLTGLLLLALPLASAGAVHLSVSGHKDSYTDGGRQDGGPLPPPVITPPDAEAGGRSTNGRVWVEDLAEPFNATVMEYAQLGAVTDLSLWPSTIKKVDFPGQMQTFLNQSNDLDLETTLYIVFFGINDYEDSKSGAMVQTIFSGLSDRNCGINSMDNGESLNGNPPGQEH